MTGRPRDRLAVVGPGRLGTVLAAALEAAGHQVIAAGGGGEAARARFRARFPGAVTSTDPADAVAAADVVVFATPDDAIEPVVSTVARAAVFREGQRAIHVAGSLGLRPLRRAALAGARTAACHPAQTVSSADAPAEVLAGAAWAVTASAADRPWARALVRQAGGVPHDVADARRPLYHAGLTVGSNATAAVVALARQLLRAAAVDDPAGFLGPLVRSSVDNALRHGSAAITGPVARADVGTLRAHLTELDADAPALAAAYRTLSLVVLGQVRGNLPAELAAALETALQPPTAPESVKQRSGSDPTHEPLKQPSGSHPTTRPTTPQGWDVHRCDG